MKMAIIFDSEMNFTFSSRLEQCLTAYSFRRQPMFIGILAMEVLLSGLTLFIMHCIYKDREFRRVWSLIGRDLKVSF